MMRFDPETFYDEDTLRLLGLESQALARGRKDGTLRYRQLGRARLYKGEWLQEWLSRSQEESGKARSR